MRRGTSIISLVLAAGLSMQAAAADLCMPGLPGSTKAPASAGAPHTCMQDYPASALRAGEQGSVDVAFFIKKDGTVYLPYVMQSSGYPDLDEAAVACARRFTYAPATRSGKPVEVPWRARVIFKLSGFFDPPPFGAVQPLFKPAPPPKNPKRAKPDPHCIPVAQLSQRNLA